MIAKRVNKGLNDFLALHELGDGLRTQVGVIMCDDGYESVQEILDDVDFVRSFVKKQSDSGYWMYTREKIRDARSS